MNNRVNGSQTFWAINFVVKPRIWRALEKYGFAIFFDAGDSSLDIEPWMVICLPPGWRVEEGAFQNEFYDPDESLRFIDFFGYAHRDALFIDVKQARKRLGSIKQGNVSRLSEMDHTFGFAIELVQVGDPSSAISQTI